MVEIKVDVNSSGVSRGLDRFEDVLDSELNISLASSFFNMSGLAKYQHRYKVRTGRLQQATKAMVRDLTADLYIDDSIAPYGVYVHEGHHNGAWAPDKFVEKALKNGEPALMRSLGNAIQRAITYSGV